VDGDTLIARIDLGCNVWFRTRVRFANVNCPSLSTQEGKMAKNFTEAFIKNAEKTYVKILKKGKYGRWIVNFFNEKGDCLNDLLLIEGYATPYS